MGPGQKILTRVGSNFLALGLGRVSHLWFGYGFGKFPLKMSNFSSFCPSGQKKVIGLGQKVPGPEPSQPLIYCGSMICSGRVRAHLYSLKVPDLDIEIRIQQWDIKHY